MTAQVVTKQIKDAAAAPFVVALWDDGTGILKPVQHWDPDQLALLATAAGQGDSLAALVAILAKLPSAPATQATLASVLAKMIAAPSTEAKQDVLIAGLAGLLRTTTPGGLQTLGSTLARPADTTAYAQYDLVANATSGAAATEIQNAVRGAGECFRWEGARLRTNNPAAKGKTFRVHLFRQAPTLTVQDNGVFNPTGAQTLAVADIAGYVGYLDIPITEAGVAGAGGRANLSAPRTASPQAGTSLWWVMEQRDSGGYTPLNAEQFALTLEGIWP